MSVPVIDRAGPTEYQEFNIVQGQRGKSFIMIVVAAIIVIAAFACLAYWVVLP